MREQDYVGRAKLSPARTFKSPMDVVETNDIECVEKFAILKAWEADEVALLRAEDEGMGGGEHAYLHNVRAALEYRNGLSDSFEAALLPKACRAAAARRHDHSDVGTSHLANRCFPKGARATCRSRRPNALGYRINTKRSTRRPFCASLAGRDHYSRATRQTTRGERRDFEGGSRTGGAR